MTALAGRSILFGTLTILFIVLGLYICDTSHAHGASNWGPDDFGDRDGVIEVYRDRVGFHGILAEEIREYNYQRSTLFPDEDQIKQVKTLAQAEVRIHTGASPDFACGGGALVWIGFDIKDEVTIADGCWDWYEQGETQPLRGTILHEVMGHLNGIHHHEVCTPEEQAITVMVSGVNNSGCGVPLQSLGSHDIATLAAPDDGVTTESVPTRYGSAALNYTPTVRYKPYVRHKIH